MSKKYRSMSVVAKGFVPDLTRKYVVEGCEVTTLHGTIKGKVVGQQPINRTTQVRIEQQTIIERLRGIGDVTVSTDGAPVVYSRLKPASRFVAAILEEKRLIENDEVPDEPSTDSKYEDYLVEVPAVPEDVLVFLRSRRNRLVSLSNGEDDWRFHWKAGERANRGGLLLTYAYEYNLASQHVPVPRILIPHYGKIVSIGDIDSTIYPNPILTMQPRRLDKGDENAEMQDPYERVIGYLDHLKDTPGFPSKGYETLKSVEVSRRAIPGREHEFEAG